MAEEGHATLNSRLRPILHLSSNCQRKEMLAMCLYTAPEKRFAYGDRS